MKSSVQTGALPFKFLKTLYLFGKSDIPAAALPSMAIALVLAGPSNLHLITKGFIWNQLHLLTFQLDGIEEDRIAKPHRPLPSGRISPAQATLLYYVLFLLMWVAAIHTNTTTCTLVYSVAIVIYNEGGLAAIPVVKNVIGAIGLACYCWGTTIILDHGKELHGLKAIAVLMIGAIFATTGHAQDFRDRSADATRGRKTIPLLLSQPVARWSLAAMTTAWTLGLIALWKPPAIASLVYAAAGLRCLGGFVSSHDEKDDYISYCWYGFWLLGSNLLPIFPRWRGELV
ncbi:Integral membrane protein [Venustampulla echinocandica]|uniref:Integral membrane protein n=1 Tax=Venustampulla echinocandica TaxID=2656787 RepID=A0A370TAS0_9HELO|nr:Integral membrane protein [Venustampulla echinocandica]RDL31029.1 Integral membrane protein [Venustampulla echinocandica]